MSRMRNLSTFLFPTVGQRVVQLERALKSRTLQRGRDQKNSPSRFRFRPPLPLTFPLRVLPSDSVSTYLRSVLGASIKLRNASHAFKTSKRAVAAICVKFNYQHFHSYSCNVWKNLWKLIGAR